MKKLLILLLSMALLVSGMFFLTSCDGDADEEENESNENNNDENNDENNSSSSKVDYTVNVVDQDGNAVAGVEVTFKVGPKSTYTATSDATGKAVINIEETALPIRASYTATKLPSGYLKGEATYVDFATGSKTANLEIVKGIAYTVYVKNSSGAALSGASVQICVDGVCNAAVNTDVDGKVVYYLSPDFDEAYAQFNAAPNGYNAPETNKIYYTEGVTEVTFVLTEA